MTSASELGKQVETLLRNYLEAGRREVKAVISRVQTSSSSPMKGNSTRTPSKKTVASKPSTSLKQAYVRRSSESVAALVEKVDMAIRNQPGASIRDICRDVQVEQNELTRPMVILRETGKFARWAHAAKCVTFLRFPAQVAARKPKQRLAIEMAVNTAARKTTPRVLPDLASNEVRAQIEQETINAIRLLGQNAPSAADVAYEVYIEGLFNKLTPESFRTKENSPMSLSDSGLSKEAIQLLRADALGLQTQDAGDVQREP